LGDFGEVGFRGLFGKKGEIRAFGRPVVGGLVGEGPEVVFRRGGGGGWWWVAWVWVVFGLREDRDGGAGMGGVRLKEKK
jgi:hypothetical protein